MAERRLEQETMCAARYTTCYSSIVATGKKGRAPGELGRPSGVAIHKDTSDICS